MKTVCEGYCGGYFELGKGKTVGGEWFCESCYGQYLRKQYQ